MPLEGAVGVLTAKIAEWDSESRGRRQHNKHGRVTFCTRQRSNVTVWKYFNRADKTVTCSKATLYNSSTSAMQNHRYTQCRVY